MRTSMMVGVALTLAACSSDGVVTGPTGGTIPPAADASSMWAGERTCPAGLVRLQVELAGEAGPTLFYRGEARVHLSIDGVAHVTGPRHRFRVEGEEVFLSPSRDTSEIEFYAGLGGDCDWITARRIL